MSIDRRGFFAWLSGICGGLVAGKAVAGQPQAEKPVRILHGEYSFPGWLMLFVDHVSIVRSDAGYYDVTVATGGRRHAYVGPDLHAAVAAAMLGVSRATMMNRFTDSHLEAARELVIRFDVCVELRCHISGQKYAATLYDRRLHKEIANSRTWRHDIAIDECRKAIERWYPIRMDAVADAVRRALERSP